MRTLALISAVVLCVGLATELPAEAGGVINARIHTMDSDHPTAESLAWDDNGRIVFVGDADSLMAEWPDLMPTDLGGRTVLPGLIDAHAHIMGRGLARLPADLDGAESIEEVIERLQAKARDLPAGAWLTGRGWDQTRWEGQQFPAAADLDRAFPDRPVYLVRVDGHAGWANSAALERVERELAGDWQPQGGHIHRDEEGRPTGVLIDAAMDLVETAIPEPGPDVRNRALALVMDEMNRYGLTGVHDAGTSLDDFRLFRRQADAGRLTVRIHAMADGDEAMLDWLCENGIHDGERLSARAVKYYGDGALGSRGAALLEDYSDDPGNRGLLFESDQAMQAKVDKAAGCGLQVAIHAIGDAANRQALEALARAGERFGNNPGRHRIEHVQIIRPDDIPRLAEHDIIASMQPIHATSDMRWAEDRLGAERLEGAYAWQRVLEAGAHLALGSDFPVEPVNPWLGVHAAVTRQRDGLPPCGWRPEERLSVEQALSGFTIDAAYAGFAETRVGSLETGKFADFVVIDADPFEVDPAELAEIGVLRTVVGGEIVYQRDAE